MPRWNRDELMNGNCEKLLKYGITRCELRRTHPQAAFMIEIIRANDRPGRRKWFGYEDRRG